jgi:mannose-6-phosphate isomerase-like protein (cupin superfamily)
MTDYTVKEIDDLEAMNGVFRRARDELGVSSFGINVLDLPPDSDGYPDHAEPDQEEIYVPLSGGGEVEVAGERIPVDPATMVWVGPNTKHKFWPGSKGIRLLAVGAIPGRPYEPPDAQAILENTGGESDHAVKKIDDMEAAFGGGFRKARAELGATSVGIQVLDFPPNADAHPEHDHAEDGQEEVYVVLDGAAEILIDDEPIDLAPGTMVRVASGTRRKIRTADSPARIVAFGGIPGQAYEVVGFTELE